MEREGWRDERDIWTEILERERERGKQRQREREVEEAPALFDYSLL